MESLEELRQDCEELQQLLQRAVRSNVRQLLASEITSLESKITHLQESHDASRNQAVNSTATNEVPKEEASPFKEPVAKKPTSPPIYTTKISSYGWDQTNKLVKIYVTLSDVEKIPKEDIKLDLTIDSFSLMVHNLNGKNHNLQINKLLEQIIPSECSHKVKSGTVIISLKKEKAQNWECLTRAEKTSKEVKTPKLDKDKDPQESIMDLMRQMYNEGDDEMKRTIAKAWTESREKQASGSMF